MVFLKKNKLVTKAIDGQFNPKLYFGASSIFRNFYKDLKIMSFERSMEGLFEDIYPKIAGFENSKLNHNRPFQFDYLLDL